MNANTFRAACFLVVLAICLATAALASPFSSPRGYSLSMPVGWHLQPPMVPGEDAHIVVNQKIAVGHRVTTPILFS